MSWLRSSPLRHSLTRGGSGSGSSAPKFSTLGERGGSSGNTSQQSILRQRPIDTATDCDPRACYDSFCKHWQQAHDIIQHSESPHKPPTHDDVLGVVSHLDFMVTLLLVELHHCNKIALPTLDATAAAAPPAPCLEFMLSENLLDKLYEWGCTTGRYANAVRLEQLKLYELLVSHSRHQLLCHEPFLRPLLKILASSQGEIFPPDLEKRLVILLNQLCVVLMQNVHLLDLFFFSAQAHVQERAQHASAVQPKSGTTTNFIIFSLLIPYVHREGSLGHQARDALLLCMALSQKNSNIGTYIAQYSAMCPLLVTGLGGLYSRLPNSIEITSIDWHRITPDDVTEIPELTLFMNALEFCNAVVQVAHEMIKNQLLDFMYQGFIVPVLGPAILQSLNGKHLQTNIDSQISAMSYLDLILRSITEPGLLRAFVRFLLDTEKFDGERILDALVERLNSPDANLCMVTMALFDTLLSLHCEDLMLELMLKYMLPGKHVPISYRHKINKIDPYINSAEFFLDLTPDVMKRARELTKHKNLGDTVMSAQTVNMSTVLPTTTAPTTALVPLPSPTSTMSKTIGANWNYYGLYTGDSLYANIHAYLFEAHWRIAQCQRDCAKWANSYRYQKWPRSVQSNNAHVLELVKQFFAEFNTTSSLHNMLAIDGGDSGEKKQLDSLQSIGESSGYESFKWRPADEDGDVCDIAAPSSEPVDLEHNTFSSATTTTITPTTNTTMTTTTTTNAIAAYSSSSNSNSSVSASASGTGTAYIGHNERALKRDAWRISNSRSDLILSDLDFSEDLFAQGTVSLGPFLNAILAKLQTFTSNTLYVNLHLTGLITRLTWYPLPLVHSLLLRPDIAITSDTPSFHQVLRILKQQIDAELPVTEDTLEIIDIARSYLIDREFRLMNARKSNENSPMHAASLANAHNQQQQQNRSIYATISAGTPVQATPTSAYDPFRRGDSKRRSISKSITSMFSRKSTTATPASSSNSASSSGAVTNLVSGEGAATTSTMSDRTKPFGNTCETSLSTQMPERERRGSGYGSRTGDRSAMAVSAISAEGQARVLNTHASQGSPVSSSSVGAAGSVSGSTQTLSAHSTMTLTSVGSTLLGGGEIGSVGGGGGSFGSEPVSLESMSSMGVIANTSGTDRSRDLALCAVLLDEWLKELAAIAQEQSVVLVNNGVQ